MVHIHNLVLRLLLVSGSVFMALSVCAEQPVVTSALSPQTLWESALRNLGRYQETNDPSQLDHAIRSLRELTNATVDDFRPRVLLYTALTDKATRERDESLLEEIRALYQTVRLSEPTLGEEGLPLPHPSFVAGMVYWRLGAREGISDEEERKYEDMAIAAYRNAIQADPGFAATHLELAKVYYFRNENELALFEAEQAVRLEPQLADAHAMLGRIHRDNVHRDDSCYDRESVDAAVRAFKEAVRLDPESNRAHRGLSDAFVHQGRYELALFEARRAVEIADSARNRAQLGDALLGIGRPEEAAKEFREALKRKPDYASAQSQRGLALLAARRYEEAIDAYDRYLELDDSPWIYAVLYHHFALRHMGRNEEARRLIERHAGRAEEPWEENLVAYYLGKLGPEQLRERAENECQRQNSRFYVAYDQLLRGLTEEAQQGLNMYLSANLYCFTSMEIARARVTPLHDPEREVSHSYSKWPPKVPIKDTTESTDHWPPPNPIIEQAIESLREQGNEEPSPEEIAGVLNKITVDILKKGDYASAEVVAEVARDYAEEVLGPEHPGTIGTIYILARIYQTQDRYGEAEPLYKRAVGSSERVLGPEHPLTLISIESLAALYESQGRYGMAEPLYKRVLTTNKRVLGPEHPFTLRNINNLANLYQSQGRYEEAEPLHKHALATSERLFGPNHPKTLISVNNLALLYQSQGRYEEAEPLLKRALATNERELGLEHTQSLASFNNLAGLYQAQGRYGMAEPLYKRALAASERLLGSDHLQTLANANNLALLYQTQGRYEEAEPLYKRVLTVKEQVLGAEHPKTLISVNNLALLYKSQSRYREAEPLFKRALATNERVLGPEHPNTLQSVNNLAELFKSQGRYEEVEPLHKRALAARERVLGPEHPDTLISVDNLAGLFQAQGRYGEAEPLIKRALATNERVLGREHPDTLISVDNLAGLYEAQGRYGEAEPLLFRALAARERVLGAEHPATLESVNHLAGLYHTLGLYESAEPLYKRALAARENVLGPEHSDTLISVDNLAALYRSQGRYREAEPLHKHALATNERVLGPKHPNTLKSINNLALLYQAQGRYEESEPLYKRALAASEQVLGRDHPFTSTTQLNLAFTLINQRKFDKALHELRRLDTQLRAFMGLQLATTEKQRVKRQLLATQSTLQDVVFTLAVRHPMRDTVRLAADIILRWKRLAGEEEAVVARLARTSQDRRVVDLAQKTRVARARLSHLVNLPEPNGAAIASQRVELEGLETMLAQLSRNFRRQVASRSIKWQSVQRALTPGSALLELRAYRPVNFKSGELGDHHWVALLIPADLGDGAALRVVDLGPVANSLHALAALRSDEASTARGVGLAPTKAPALDAYANLFGKLDTALAGYETLYIAPDGHLDLVAFARMLLPDGRYWIERQELRQVRSGRDLLPNPTASEATGMVVFGGIDYERFIDTEEAYRSERSEAAAHGQSLSADVQLALNHRRRAEYGNFAKLKHTASEARTVARYYRDYYSRKAQVHIGVAASEARLKNLTPPPRVLHLATHGFFLEGRRAHTERPLTLAGLAFAGANRGLERKHSR